MPNMGSPTAGKNLGLAKLLLASDPKAGKTDFAAMAALFGFRILYLDGDVAAQTILNLPQKVKENIFLLRCGDQFTAEGGIDAGYAHFFKQFITARPTLVWNDTNQRIYSVLTDGAENLTDEYWLIRPSAMDHTCILVIEYSALARSAMQWAANEAGIDLGEIGPGQTDDRKEMRGIYQGAGEKLTQYLLAIQRARCHVICLSHPSEFVKLMDPPGRPIGSVKEKDKIIAWTKMVFKSSSNNHALSMGSYFTDIAWLETKIMGDRVIDFTPSNQRIVGGHFQGRYEVKNHETDLKGYKDGFTFATLVRKLGGNIPDEPAPFDHWLTIQQGYSAPIASKKPVVLSKSKPATQQRQPAAVNQAPVLVAPPSKTILNLSGRKPMTPVK